MHEAGCADALEIKVAGKVIAAGPQRLQRRIELRFHLDEGAGGRRRAAAHRQPHALRLPGDAVAVDPLDPQHEAVGLLALLAQLDETGERNAIGRIAQHRMIDQHGLQRGDGKAGGYGEEPKRHHEADWPPAQQHRGDGAGCPRSRCRPPGRFALGGEIEDDAGAEGDRKPRQQAARPDLGERPLANALGDGELGAASASRSMPAPAPPTGQVRVPVCPRAHCARRPRPPPRAPQEEKPSRAKSRRHAT